MREYSNSWSSVIESVRKGRSWSGDERNCFYLNLRGDNFVDLSYVSGLDFKNDGRGIGLTDWDRDGDIDIIYRNRDAPRVRVIKNNFTNSQHYHYNTNDNINVQRCPIYKVIVHQ